MANSRPTGSAETRSSLINGRAYIEAARGREGAWGYTPGADPRPEPTILACLAGLEPPLGWLKGVDLSWAVYDQVIERKKEIETEWIELIEDFPDRFTVGSDKIGHCQT